MSLANVVIVINWSSAHPLETLAFFAALFYWLSALSGWYRSKRNSLADSVQFDEPAKRLLEDAGAGDGKVYVLSDDGEIVEIDQLDKTTRS